MTLLLLLMSWLVLLLLLLQSERETLSLEDLWFAACAEEKTPRPSPHRRRPPTVPLPDEGALGASCSATDPFQDSDSDVDDKYKSLGGSLGASRKALLRTTWRAMENAKGPAASIKSRKRTPGALGGLGALGARGRVSRGYNGASGRPPLLQAFEALSEDEFLGGPRPGGLGHEERRHLLQQGMDFKETVLPSQRKVWGPEERERWQRSKRLRHLIKNKQV